MSQVYIGLGWTKEVAETLRLEKLGRNIPVWPHTLACGQRTRILFRFKRRMGYLLRALVLLSL